MTLTYQSFRMTLSPDDNALSYQVRSQKVKWFKRYHPDKIPRQTDGMDRWTHTVIPTYPQPPTLFGRYKNLMGFNSLYTLTPEVQTLV